MLRMQQAAAEAHITIAVLSEAYLKAEFTQPEWAAAFAQDPRGEKRKLIPVRVTLCSPEGLLKAIIYVDLVNLSEQDAQRALIDGLKPTGKPVGPIRFPGQPIGPSVSTASFPPNLARLHGVPNLPPHYLPRAEDVARLKQKLLAGDGNVGITGQFSAIGVQGMGGIGKNRAGHGAGARPGGAQGIPRWNLLVDGRSEAKPARPAEPAFVPVNRV